VQEPNEIPLEYSCDNLVVKKPSSAWYV